MMHLILAFFISFAARAAVAVKPAETPAPAPIAATTPLFLKITGETIADAPVKNAKGETVSLASVLQGKWSVVTFAKSANINAESAAGYFRSLVPYLKKLDYQVVLVSPDAPVKKIGEAIEADGQVLIDDTKAAFNSMGLNSRSEPIHTIYLVSPDRQIMFQFASVTDQIPFSGEVLVLAARVYRDAFREKK